VKRPRPLHSIDRASGAALLRALADEWDAAHAQSVQHLLTVEADPAWPATASGAGTGGSRPSEPGSPTERAALDHDRAATAALAVLLAQRRAIAAAEVALGGLRDRRPDRPRALCPRCDMPLDPNYQRCQQIIDGVQCGTRAGADRRCKTCDEPQQPGRSLRAGECDACRQHRRRTGRARIATSRLALNEGLIAEGEVWHGQVDA
jgi:hypothetical protein